MFMSYPMKLSLFLNPGEDVWCILFGLFVDFVAMTVVDMLATIVGH